MLERRGGADDIEAGVPEVKVTFPQIERARRANGSREPQCRPRSASAT
jgi:hypothetical protein